MQNRFHIKIYEHTNKIIVFVILFNTTRFSNSFYNLNEFEEKIF